MKRKHLFLTILFLEMAFIYVPDFGGLIRPFPFHTTSITLSTYIYFHFEHFAFITLGWLLWKDSTIAEWKTNVVFFGVLVFDYLDWVFTCNQAWGGTFLTGNIVKLLAFVVLTWNTDNE